MKLGRCTWGPFNWNVELDIIDCFIMPNNKRLIGFKLLKWLSKRAWLLTRHESFQSSRTNLSCRLEQWELPWSILPLHFLVIKIDLLRNTLHLIASVAI